MFLVDSPFKIFTSDLRCDVPIFGHVTLKKVTFFRKSKIVNIYSINAKFYTLIHIATPIRHVKFYNDPINATYVSIATHVPLRSIGPFFTKFNNTVASTILYGSFQYYCSSFVLSSSCHRQKFGNLGPRSRSRSREMYKTT
jgi:hypothetical protein